jgi:hypothetical protein
MKRARRTSRALRAPWLPWLAGALACAACAKTGQGASGDAGAPPVGPPSVTPLTPEAGPTATETSELTLDPADAPPARMKLLDAGQSPRQKLRYAWQTGLRETLVMDLRTSASTEEGTSKQPEIELPPVHIVLAIDPQATSAEGDLTYAWRVTSTAVSPESHTPATLADGMRAEVAAIEHLSGTAVVTSRGISTRISVDPEQWHEVAAQASRSRDAQASRAGAGAGASDAESASRAGAGATSQMVEQVRQTLRDVAAPFPEEAVGPGARWEKLSQLASRDAHVTQTEVFTLTQISATRGALDGVLAQTAPPQPLLSPGGAPGTEARIESMLASGDGKTQFDLDRLVPQTQFGGTTTMVVSSHSGEEDARTMTMIMRVEIVLAGTMR